MYYLTVYERYKKYAQFHPLVLFTLLLSALIASCEPQLTGLLKGKVNIGPLTPVERVGVPTPIPPPEVFTSRGIEIYKENGVLERTLYFNPDGTLSVSLPVGTYRVELIQTGIDHASELPAVITIRENQTTVLDITIDTGIR